MVDWVTLGALIAIIGTLATVQIALLRDVKGEIKDIKQSIVALDHKFDRKFDFLYEQILDINRRLPAAPELVVSSSKWR